MVMVICWIGRSARTIFLMLMPVWSWSRREMARAANTMLRWASGPPAKPTKRLTENHRSLVGDSHNQREVPDIPKSASYSAAKYLRRPLANVGSTALATSTSMAGVITPFRV